jgi:hypothetical protein
MNEKQLYVCLVNFRSPSGDLVKFVGAAIAADTREAENQAIEEGISQYGQHLRSWQIVVDALSMKRQQLERAAREVLGWTGPEE